MLDLSTSSLPAAMSIQPPAPRGLNIYTGDRPVTLPTFHDDSRAPGHNSRQPSTAEAYHGPEVFNHLSFDPAIDFQSGWSSVHVHHSPPQIIMSAWGSGDRRFSQGNELVFSGQPSFHSSAPKWTKRLDSHGQQSSHLPILAPSPDSAVASYQHCVVPQHIPGPVNHCGVSQSSLRTPTYFATSQPGLPSYPTPADHPPRRNASLPALDPFFQTSSSTPPPYPAVRHQMSHVGHATQLYTEKASTIPDVRFRSLSDPAIGRSFYALAPFIHPASAPLPLRERLPSSERLPAYDLPSGCASRPSTASSLIHQWSSKSPSAPTERHSISPDVCVVEPQRLPLVRAARSSSSSAGDVNANLSVVFEQPGYAGLSGAAIYRGYKGEDPDPSLYYPDDQSTLAAADVLTSLGGGEDGGRKRRATGSSEGPAQKRRKGEKGSGNDVWPPRAELIFSTCIAHVPPIDRQKIMFYNKPCGRNEIVALVLSIATGKPYSRKQVSSHSQVIKNKESLPDNIRKILTTHEGEVDRGVGRDSGSITDFVVHPSIYHFLEVEIGTDLTRMLRPDWYLEQEEGGKRESKTRKAVGRRVPSSSRPLAGGHPHTAQEAVLPERVLSEMAYNSQPGPSTYCAGPSHIFQPEPRSQSSSLPIVFPSRLSIIGHTVNGAFHLTSNEERPLFAGVDVIPVREIVLLSSRYPELAAPHLSQIPIYHLDVPLGLPRDGTLRTELVQSFCGWEFQLDLASSHQGDLYIDTTMGFVSASGQRHAPPGTRSPLALVGDRVVQYRSNETFFLELLQELNRGSETDAMLPHFYLLQEVKANAGPDNRNGTTVMVLIYTLSVSYDDGFPVYCREVAL
ncbi:transcriptional enhancer factor, partial [Tremellales sp. Uapishka_1]